MVLHKSCNLAYVCWFSSQVVFDVFGDGEFFPNDELIKFLGKYVCPADMELLGLCENVLFLICGFDQADMNIVSRP